MAGARVLIATFMAALGKAWQHRPDGDVVRVWYGNGDAQRDTWFLVSLKAFVTLSPPLVVLMADEINAARARGLRGQVEVEVFRNNTTGAYKVAVAAVGCP